MRRENHELGAAAEQYLKSYAKVAVYREEKI
jgi:hypothetical protein